ncbi:helix-turn-helix transcriptional regulator [Nakamurella flava]|uniref:Helix-turn-helix transcriptional regulator n=1 Tax=Nakamurella flava TaxID=2576308 RepID=A0A4U6QMI0_9ACTN|nr:helix-turn-helix transcriptional regulator [Nakamurella flava]TKV61840.1 helix-turn-helix transcriptional regulator [Nakamurella flava]
MAELTPGQTVRRAREQLGHTRDHLAVLADVSSSMVARLELRDHIPNVLALGRIVRVLNLDISDVVAAVAADEAERPDRRRGARRTPISA